MKILSSRRSPSAGDFERNAKRLKIYIWVIHRCSLCQYPCGFVFTANNSVLYDHGCYCTIFRNRLKRSSWAEVEDFYHRFTDDEEKKWMNSFWAFDVLKPKKIWPPLKKKMEEESSFAVLAPADTDAGKSSSFPLMSAPLKANTA